MKKLCLLVIHYKTSLKYFLNFLIKNINECSKSKTTSKARERFVIQKKVLLNLKKFNFFIVKVFKALYTYNAKRPEEISFSEGDLIYVSDMVSDKNWWRARCNNLDGYVPSNYSNFFLINF